MVLRRLSPEPRHGTLLEGTFEEVESKGTEFPGSGTALVKPMITGSARR